MGPAGAQPHPAPLQATVNGCCRPHPAAKRTLGCGEGCCWMACGGHWSVAAADSFKSGTRRQLQRLRRLHCSQYSTGLAHPVTDQTCGPTCTCIGVS